MPEEKYTGPDGRKSFGRKVVLNLAAELRTSHNVIRSSADASFEILTEELKLAKDPKSESDYLIPILVEYSLYAADDTGRNLGEVSRGVLEGVNRTALRLTLEPAKLLEKTIRAMLLESDWRDVDLRIVIESFIKKSVPDGKTLLKKIFSAGLSGESELKAA